MIGDEILPASLCCVRPIAALQASQLSVLEESWVSQANARQRRGRAGRVRSGWVSERVSEWVSEWVSGWVGGKIIG